MTEQSQQKMPSHNQQSQKEQPDIRADKNQADKNQDDKNMNKKSGSYEKEDSDDSKWSQKR